MSPQPSLAVRLFGTEEPVTPARILRAGPLTVELDAGNLRHIKHGGVEVIRAVSFIVRDRNWGTYNPMIEDLAFDEGPDGFVVTYRARASDASQAFRYRARIEGSAGTLAFSAEGEAETDFLTNRTGFVVLHPSAASGKPVTVEHADGGVEQATFPTIIDPVQPMMNLRSLTHEASPGLTVTCRLEGDVYEMEDQRNWTDASYKTYVRPLALPWPYTLSQGEALDQAVRVNVTGSAAAAPKGASTRIKLGASLGPVPPLGLGFDPSEAQDTLAKADLLRRVGARALIGAYDPSKGHGDKALADILRVAQAIGAEPWLEAVIVSVDDFAEEIAALGRKVDALGSPFQTVLVSPLPDLKCTLPGSPWPPAPPPRAFFEAARRAFPKGRLGGGMFSLFTEMNRKRPPVDLIDLVSFTTTATLHAGDDVSITEGMECLPAMALSAAAIAGGRPYAVGPSAIGMRMNPYGEAPLANPGNIRQAMNFNDPRQRGLLGAAWALGYFARFAAGGASAIALGGTTGAFGLVHVKQSWPQPWFDDEGGVLPMFHVLRGLAALGGKRMRAVEASESIEAIAAKDETGAVLWLANRTGVEQRVMLPGPARDLFRLDACSFVDAARDPEAVSRRSGPFSESELLLPPYAVARVGLVH
jgi:D-apionolactonase